MIRKFILKVVAISNTALFITSALLVLLASVLITVVEPDTFPTVFDGFWWTLYIHYWGVKAIRKDKSLSNSLSIRVW
ncbi:hypothetical protein [Virgibacillus senegalensis]|uniref:hypothetical protein n=1 Tax=Virgibacillus senegalensis TaxID=1499679 RepID=UPI00069F1E95|nr:hypothetical protein [Virgibacillus senegalensis]